VGPGLEKLGLAQGSDVQRSDYDAVYSQVNHVTVEDREPSGQLPGEGRPPGRLLAAEPHPRPSA